MGAGEALSTRPDARPSLAHPLPRAKRKSGLCRVAIEITPGQKEVLDAFCKRLRVTTKELVTVVALSEMESNDDSRSELMNWIVSGVDDFIVRRRVPVPAF